MTPEEEWLASFGLTEEVTAQELEQAGGALGAGAMGTLEGAVPFFGKQVREAITSPALREQQRADYPVITTLGEFLGSMVPATGTAKLASKLAGPAATATELALTSAGVEGAMGGATAAAKGGDIMDVALSSLLGGTLGGIGGATQARSASKAKTAAQEALEKSPKYKEQIKQVNKLSNALSESEKRLARVEASLESEKIGLRTAAQKDLNKLKSNLEKSQKDLDALRVKAEKSPPADRTSPEFQAWEQSKRDVNRLQAQYDQTQRKIRELEATAPTKLGAERERGIAAAQRDVAKAEERVFSAQEKEELNNALLKVMREREDEVAAAAKVRAKNERIKREQAKSEAEAAPTVEAPAPAPVEEPPMTFGRNLTQREIELLEDMLASDKTYRKIQEEIGIDKSTLSRRLKAFNITKESAKANVAKRAEERAALESAARDVVPEPTPAATAPEEKLEKVPKVSRNILSPAERRRLQQQEILGPVRKEAEAQRFGRAQERLQQAMSPAPALEESRFATEMATRQQQLGDIGDELSRAIQIREEALMSLQRAQPESQPALLQQLQNAEQVIGRKAKEFDDVAKALEEETFMLTAKREPVVRAEQGIVAADRQRLQEAQALLAQMDNVSPGLKDQLLKILGPSALIRSFSGPAISELTDKDVKAVLTSQ